MLFFMYPRSQKNMWTSLPILKTGEEINAKVVDFNEEDKKISLSIKAMLAPEPKEVKEEEFVQKESDEDVVSVDIDAVIAKQNAEEDSAE